MAAPTYFSFDAVTGVFTSAAEADPSPLEEDVWLVPAQATLVSPPTVGDKQAAVWKDGAWSTAIDRRGEVWFKPDGEETTVTDLGDPAQQGLLAIRPEAPPPSVPDGPLLGDWRRGLLRWGRLSEVTGKIDTLVKSDDAALRLAGLDARELSEYALRVYRTELLQLAPHLGFSEAEVDESLWRADRVAKGDLSGIWPLPQA